MIRPAAPPLHLDTSFLIRALESGFPEAAVLDRWLDGRRAVAISSLAWGEFLCGPVREPHEKVVREMAPDIVAIGAEEAVEAARLFNLAGRRRNSFPDCIIAATALVAGAELATSNRADFELFAEAGLMLADAPETA